jgi:hypothetical protein
MNSNCNTVHFVAQRDVCFSGMCLTKHRPSYFVTVLFTRHIRDLLHAVVVSSVGYNIGDICKYSCICRTADDVLLLSSSWDCDGLHCTA